MIELLKKASVPQLISAQDASVLFEDLKGLEVESLISSYKLDGSLGVYNSFLDGEALTPDIQDLDKVLKRDFNKIRSTLRIKHLERFNPILRGFCQKLFKDHKLLMSSGLYFTPHQEAQGLLYHSDHQHIIIYQLIGQKRWLFPKIKDELVKDFSADQTLNYQINEKIKSFEVMEIVLKEGEALTVPYGISHRAINDQNFPSAHLTFAEEDVNRREFLTFFCEEILGIKDFDSRFYEQINPAALTAEFKVLPLKERERLITDFYLRKRLLKYKFGTFSQ